MIFVAIMVAVAAAGILRLYLLQRRARTRMSTIDGFRSSLRRLSEQPSVASLPPQDTPPGAPSASEAVSTGSMKDAPGDPGPHNLESSEGLRLDPERREAARRRIRARRASDARAAG